MNDKDRSIEIIIEQIYLALKANEAFGDMAHNKAVLRQKLGFAWDLGKESVTAKNNK